ncbi:MAG TPA: methyltransferase [Candidatus Binataceae bacterium]|nr:methyltransferase [Candidatus Binataceae bacterium]
MSNLGVALLFFGELIPLVRGEFFGGPPVELTWANLIWIGGSMLMAMLSLVRAPAASSMINFRSVMATTSMMAAPVAMRPDMRSVGLLAALAVAIEFFGILLSQISRLYLGRKFGLLPANRGIVKSGPFRFVRHPIYAGWLILIAGYVMAYPSLLNAMMVAATLPLMMWRIRLEEDLLITDPMYCEYCHSTPYRLIPGLF